MLVIIDSTFESCLGKRSKRNVAELKVVASSYLQNPLSVPPSLDFQIKISRQLRSRSTGEEDVLNRMTSDHSWLGDLCCTHYAHYVLSLLQLTKIPD